MGSTMPRHRHALRLLLASALCLVSVIATAAPASAFVEPIRTRLPIVAGTELQFPGQNCTAGLVLVSTSPFSRLTTAQRAVRYVLTAKHCGGKGAIVSVRGEAVGQVSWVDPLSDLALVRVAPEVSGQPFCAPTSQGFHCTGGPTITPRASGRVILTSLRTRSTEDVAVIGTGAPATGQLFCVSGRTSGETCSWTSVAWKQAYGSRDPGEMAAKSASALVLGGDSGAPVVTPQGKILGILNGDHVSMDERVMLYTSVSRFFEATYGYGLAPA